MYNMLLDKLPTEYKGYLIRTDFRIGIQLTQILEDAELSDEDRVLGALDLLYGKGIPDNMYIALAGLRWFVSGGIKNNDDLSIDDPEDIPDTDVIDDEVQDLTSNGDELAFDFDVDAGLIDVAFRTQYGVNLSYERLHWFSFLSMFRGIKDTVLNDVMYYRTVDISKLPKSQQPEMRKLKNKYKINKLTPQRRAELEACFGSEWRQHI